MVAKILRARLLLFLGIFFAFQGFAANNFNSAVRPEGTDFEEILRRGLQLYELKAGPGLHLHGLVSGTSDVAVSLSSPFSDLDFSTLEAWQNPDDIKKAFILGRDERFMSWVKDSSSFPRRPTWLYPDDGCYARAEVFRDHVKEEGYTGKIYKLFVFGNLKVLTQNHPAGSVSWWYHVVPLVYDGIDAFVIDPAINPNRPLLASEWADLVNENRDAKIKFTICAGEAVGPYDTCKHPTFDQSAYAYQDQRGFFNTEWDRLLRLHRNPGVELGDLPPWTLNQVEDLTNDIDEIDLNNQNGTDDIDNSTVVNSNENTPTIEHALPENEQTIQDDEKEIPSVNDQIESI